VEHRVIIDRLEQSLLNSLPRLIQEELRRELTKHNRVVSEQIASRLDVGTHTPVNNLSAAVVPTRPAVSTPVTALQLLHSGQVNSAFETVNAVLVDVHSQYVIHTVCIR